MSLERIEILGLASARSMRKVAVPEWGGDVHIGLMTGAERLWLDEASEKSRENYTATIVVLTACDEAGKRIFLDTDVAAVSLHPTSILERIARTSLEVNAISIQDHNRIRKGLRQRPLRRFLVRLAAHYGCTQGELLERFTSPELSEMLAFESEYGFPDLTWAVGEICTVLASVMGDGKKKWHPADFAPYFESQRPRQTTRDHARMFKAMADSHQ